jgi:maltose alpha-D-glucosyltransferase/alpha-amylase
MMTADRGMTIMADRGSTDPLWYRDAVIYQLHVKTYRDTTGSGMGDFRGLMEKLDYLEDLGVTTLWLLPFYPSPRRDDGYDIADYRSVHPDYGTMRDFRAFLNAAHRRGMRVITEMVLNHTSDQHAWFRRARTSPPGSRNRDYYVWSDAPDRYRDARIIFTDFEPSNWSWDPVAKAYFWHRFYSHQPDLNYDNPQVRRTMLRTLDFWLDMGVDGLRLDAVPYLYEREGTNCENLPETYEYLRELRAHIDSRYSDRMLLAEANQWPEDAVAYFGRGDICHTAFHFPLMPRMYIALRMEDRFPIVDILDQTPSIPETCQWMIFLRNHDELTLEMVTDEERDYMYRAYARDARARINAGIRRRLSPLLSNNRRTIELLNVLLLSLPGTPVIYYGDEIGMGDNYYLGDRNGVRTPMQWSPGKNAGFSECNPQKLYLPVIIDPEYHYETVNVENQQSNPASLLWWMKRIIAIRKGLTALGRGGFRVLYPENPRIFTYVREHDDERILVVANLSQSSQAVELDLSEFSGKTPIEVFSRNRFPLIRDIPYQLTLGPYGYYWFSLESERADVKVSAQRSVPVLNVKGGWKILPADVKKSLESILPSFLMESRWFGDKGFTLKRVRVAETLPLDTGAAFAHLLFLEVSFSEKPPTLYLLPLSTAPAGEAALIDPERVVARTEDGGLLYDGAHDRGVCTALLHIIGRNRSIHGSAGSLKGKRAVLFNRILDDRGVVLDRGTLIRTSPPAGSADTTSDDRSVAEGRPAEGYVKEHGPTDQRSIEPRTLRGEQSNTSVLYDDVFIMKLYRRLEIGVNPDIEITRYLTERVHYPHVPPYAGAIEYARDSESIPLCLLQGFVQNQGDAWTFALNTLRQSFDRILAERPEPASREEGSIEPVEIDDIPQVEMDYLGGFFLEMMGVLGLRTAQMHAALAGDTELPDFAPEPLSTLYMRSLYQSMRAQARKTVAFLKKRTGSLPEDARAVARLIADNEGNILSRLEKLLGRKIEGKKTRIHGDYHLGQVLFTGKDFTIIDFEGEPARALSERRIKRSPMRDVAGMIRSFHYAVFTGYLQHVQDRPEDGDFLRPWLDTWYRRVSGIYLFQYLKGAAGGGFIPDAPLDESRPGDDQNLLLEAFLLEKALYELSYELNNRPGWALIPMMGLCGLLDIDMQPQST